MPLESGRTLIFWKSNDAFDVCFRRTIGVRGNPEKKKIGNSEKKFGSRRFWRVGRSTANGQNFKDGLKHILTPKMKFLSFIPSRLWLEDHEFRIFSRIFDLNTNSCVGTGKDRP